MERSESEHWRLPLLYCLYLCVCACVCLCCRCLRVNTAHCYSSIVLASQRLARRHHSVNEGIKDDANRRRVAIMKHNYSFIRRFKCFVRASQFVLVVHRLLLQLHTAHAHPYLTCDVTCAILPSVITLQAIVFVVSVEEVGRTTGEGSFARNTMRQSEDLWQHRRLSVFCCHICMPLQISEDADNFECRWTQTACKAKGYTLSHYHPTHSLHHSALDRSINLQHSFSSLSFLPVHCLHPNQVQQRTRCCLHVGCNTACWPSGWHQTWRCEMSPLGAVVWFEQ